MDKDEYKLNAERKVAELVEQTEPETPVSYAIKRGMRALFQEYEPKRSDLLHVMWWMIQNMDEHEGVPFWAQFAVVSQLMGAPAVMSVVELEKRDA